MSVKPELSLVMPAYNEEDNIDLVIERVDAVVRRLGLRYELIVVDDGSSDNTRIKVSNYARNNRHVKVVGYNNNIGKGYTIKTGFSHAAGDIIIFMDSHAEIDPSRAPYAYYFLIVELFCSRFPL